MGHAWVTEGATTVPGKTTALKSRQQPSLPTAPIDPKGFIYHKLGNGIGIPCRIGGTVYP